MSQNDAIEESLGSVFTLTDQIAYQPDSIVSRTILDTSSTTVTLFAVDSGQRISEHSAPHEALLQVLDGEATVTVGQTDHVLGSGDSVLLPAEEPHALAGHRSFKMLLVMAR